MIDASQVCGCVSPAPSCRSSVDICIRNGCDYVTEKGDVETWVWASGDTRNRACRFSSIRAHSIISLPRETGTHTKLEKQTRSSVESLWWFPLSSDGVAKSNYKQHEILGVYFSAKVSACLG
jgi:hypothetical protein